MDKISLVGMEFYAYHGVYDEERIIGGYFLLDVEVEANMKQASEEDEVGKTINYEEIYKISKQVMNEPVKLIETIAYKIEENIKAEFDQVMAIKVIVHKKHPPLGGKVEESKFEFVRKYGRRCAKCGQGNICYNSAACWCKSYKISPSTAETLRQNYEGCLCESCFSEFGNKI